VGFLVALDDEHGHRVGQRAQSGSGSAAASSQ
jgi:hypothetical protein